MNFSNLAKICASVGFALAALAACTVNYEFDFTGSDESSAEQALKQIIAEQNAWQLREFPTYATQAGVTDYNDRLGDVTPAARARRLDEMRDFVARLDALDRTQLSQTDRINADLLTWVLGDAIGAEQVGASRVPFNTFSGFFTGALRASDGVRLETVKDYQQYIARMTDFPRWFDENIANMRAGIATGFTLPRIVLEGVVPTVKAQIKDDPERSSLFAPFEQMSDQVSAADQQRLRLAASDAISQAVTPSFAKLYEFLQGDYMAAATDTIGVSEVNNGMDYYRQQIRRYVTTDRDPGDIHRIGLAEVERIKAEMQGIIDEVGFDGGFDQFTEFLRTNPQFYAKTKEDLLKEAAYAAKRIDYVMPKFFGKLPRLPYGVVPVPDEIAPNYTTASYNPAPIGGIRGGAYWLNTYALDQRPLYELTALTLHEAVPGHHHQNAISQELENVPDFRRKLYLSAFGEGWGLYSEKLGVEMGVYQTPYEHFGRLSYEMWRACRLVIDTGIHAMGWSRQQAMDFFKANTSLSEHNIRAEVDRYISWPAQALSYKLGELKIWELRGRAEKALGSQFDLREFHDVLLGNGALPLTMLETEVDRWIASASR